MACGNQSSDLTVDNAAAKVQEFIGGDLAGCVYPDGQFAGRGIAKPYAIQWFRFAEVLYLDADNVPVRDRTFLFDTPQYAQAGAIFRPD